MANAIKRKPRKHKRGPTTMRLVLNISGLKPSGSLLPPPLINKYPKRINTRHPPIIQKLSGEKGLSLSVVFRMLMGSGFISCLTFNATLIYFIVYKIWMTDSQERNSSS